MGFSFSCLLAGFNRNGGVLRHLMYGENIGNIQQNKETEHITTLKIELHWELSRKRERESETEWEREEEGAERGWERETRKELKSLREREKRFK